MRNGLIIPVASTDCARHEVFGSAIPGGCGGGAASKAGFKPGAHSFKFVGINSGGASDASAPIVVQVT